MSTVLTDWAEEAPAPEVTAYYNRPLQLLPEPGRRKFLGNLGYLLSRKPRLPEASATFWHDVFVPSPLPWTTFVESLVYHALVVVGILAWSLWHPPGRIAQKDPFRDTKLIVYPLSPKTDLPPLNTGSSGPHKAQTGDPAYARQAILSVPREPDNRSQTIVTPPDVVLRHDVRMPNIVAWMTLPIAPAPSVPVPASQRGLLPPELSPVAPAPQVDAHRNSLTLPQTTPVAPAPELPSARSLSATTLAAEAVPPPPQVDATTRKLGSMNMTADAVAPAPQLPVSAQRTEVAGRQAAGQAVLASAVPPPPSLSGTGNHASGRMIALSVDPGAPTDAAPPAGNRRGEFSANAQGNTLGSGRPAIAATSKAANDANIGGNATAPGLPAGIRIGDSSAAPSVSANDGDPEMMANVTIDRHPIASIPPPRVATTNRKPATLSDHAPSEVESKVFGPRRFYSMTLNMPNLNSAGGTWILRFAELNAGPSKGELFSPLITRKSDPAYPSELQRANIQGSVTLYAVIHSDGSVRDIRVLDGADERLDRYASEALARCRFEPAIKDGVPVALEAVVVVPFRARRGF